MLSALKRLLGLNQSAPGASTPPPETIRHMVSGGARPRSLAPSDLSPQYLSRLRQILADDTSIGAAWLLWTEWDDRAAELAIAVRSDSQDGEALRRLCGRVDALGGPLSFAVFAKGEGTDAPFYLRGSAA